MRGLPWLLPSVVAGSLRTALVKAKDGLSFDGETTTSLLKIEVAGVFPVHDNELYLPAPNDALGEPTEAGKGIKTVHRVTPQSSDGGCDFPDALPLRPVMLPQGVEDFKPVDMPAWWPISQYAEWLTASELQVRADWLSDRFLTAARQEARDHVRLDENTGAALEGHIFSTTGLNVTHLPRFGVKQDDTSIPFYQRYAEITLAARAAIPQSVATMGHAVTLDILHPLGGERRLVHWQASDAAHLWACPDRVQSALGAATKIRMVLATPAIFKEGWKPGWLDGQLGGTPPGAGVTLKLVGVSSGRWKAVSGWSLARVNDKGQLDPSGKPGPKAIRRMVPAGTVYFFEKVAGEPAALANRWLQSVSDAEQDQRDGFGLAVWGTW
jgi:CRISPR-associated protein Cmr3